MTQKYVGTQIGFDEKSANVCMAQYEKETRVPKDNSIQSLATIFDVSTEAIKEIIRFEWFQMACI